MTSFLQKSPISLPTWAKELVLWQVNQIHYRSKEDFDETADSLRLLIEQKTILTKWEELQHCLKQLLEMIENPFAFALEHEAGSFSDEVITQIRRMSDRIANYTPAERESQILLAKTK